MELKMKLCCLFLGNPAQTVLAESLDITPTERRGQGEGHVMEKWWQRLAFCCIISRNIAKRMCTTNAQGHVFKKAVPGI